MRDLNIDDRNTNEPKQYPTIEYILYNDHTIVPIILKFKTYSTIKYVLSSFSNEKQKHLDGT